MQSDKVATSMMGILDEGESHVVKAGQVIGSATLDMRIKNKIWEGAYLDLGWLAPSCDLKFVETKTMSAIVWEECDED